MCSFECMYGCNSTATRSVYRWIMFSTCSCFINGFVCVCGGRLYISLISFFCVLISGCMYCALCLVVPHIVIEPIRCGYACVW